MKLLCVLLVGTLTACSVLNLTATASDSDLGNNTDNSKHSHRYRSRQSEDNAASKDYFSALFTSHAKDDSHNLWTAIKQDFQLDHAENTPEVQAQIAWFMHNQDYLARTARRAAPFMYYIYQDVKARHLPSELVLLPIIESAYNPFVSSSTGAAGLWQLEPGTARVFGLHQDFWYDGRRDITASTNAALDYLTYLQNFFGGNWLLAIAAYDTGEGNVEAAMRRNTQRGLETDFWSLPLAAETKSYVPRLLALAAIIQNPRAYPIQLPPISNTPYLGEVEISSQIDLAQAANLAGVSLNELKTLNPGYKRSALDPNQPYKLLLPIDRIESFKQRLINQPIDQGTLWSHYKIRHQDTWRHIAKRFNISVNELQQINHLFTKVPPVGKILLIPEDQTNEAAIATATTQAAGSAIVEPSSSQESTNAPPETNEDATSLPTNKTISTDNNDAPNSANNTVAAPDLSDTANLDASAMKTAEHENDQTPKQESNIHLYKVIHAVKANETLSSIAKSYHVSANELAKWNHLSLHSPLRRGMKLILWREMASQKKVTSTPKKSKLPEKRFTHKTNAISKSRSAYVVKNGDTLASIANKYNLSIVQLAKWNKRPQNSHLHPGQRLIIAP